MSEQPHSQGPQVRGPWRLAGYQPRRAPGLFLLSPTVWSTEGALTEGVKSQRRAGKPWESQGQGGWQSQRKVEGALQGAMGPAHPTPLVRKVSPHHQPLLHFTR